MPDNMMVDFERGLRNALGSAFPFAKIDGCWFHTPQAVMRKVRDLGLKREYEYVNIDTNGNRSYKPMRIWIRRLMGLAFVLATDVVSCFTELVEQMPENLQIDEFLEYFKSTWIEGSAVGRRVGRALFPPETWNVRNRTLHLMNRTNNVVESFNKQFSSLLDTANLQYGSSLMQ